MIEVTNLVKRYGPVRAVDDISFRVEQGRIVGFVGPNGAGKTTTMRILACYIPPTSGSATVAGRDVVRESLDVRRAIGYMPENVPLYGEMRLRDYLTYRAKLKDVPRRRRRSRIDEVMRECGVDEMSGRLVGQLSKGYRQRLGLADSLLGEPELLILDEPTIGLDPHQIRQARELVRRFGRKHTVLLSTHILSEVEMICDDVIMINRGRIVACDSLVGLMAGEGPARMMLTARGDGRAVEEALRNIEAVRHVEWLRRGEENAFSIEPKAGVDARRSVMGAVVSAGGTVLSLTQERRTLEDVFVDTLTAQGDARLV